MLDFDEFLECVARCGIDKYRAVKEVTPARAVKGFIQNLLNEMSPDEVVIEATYIHAERYDAEKETKPLKGESQKDLEKWLACWERMEIMDVHLWPTWEKEVHDILHPLFKELQMIFLAYTRSISEDSVRGIRSTPCAPFEYRLVCAYRRPRTRWRCRWMSFTTLSSTSASRQSSIVSMSCPRNSSRCILP